MQTTMPPRLEDDEERMIILWWVYQFLCFALKFDERKIKNKIVNWLYSLLVLKYTFKHMLFL